MLVAQFARSAVVSQNERKLSAFLLGAERKKPYVTLFLKI